VGEERGRVVWGGEEGEICVVEEGEGEEEC